MKTDSLHTTFADLPLEARALFLIYASGALARFGSCPPALGDLAEELEQAWNENRLCPADLTDPYRMTRLLDVHFSPPTDDRSVGSANPTSVLH